MQAVRRLQSEKIDGADIQNIINDNILHNKIVRKKDLYSWDEKFVWNFYLMEEFMKSDKVNKKWILPIIHGFVNTLSKNHSFLEYFML